MIALEQLYWGHDGNRYRSLGASSQANGDVAGRIRDKLGTPDGLSEMKPFLVSVPYEDRLIMICGQRGKPDNIGRNTLFFHTLIGDRAECSRNHINAYSLWQGGYFKSEYSGAAQAEPLPVPELPEIPASGAEPPPWDGEKLAIRSSAPENELLYRMLGARINDIPWAGFTWNPLNDFTLYAISRYAEMPKDRPCWDRQQGAAVAARQNAPTPSTPFPREEKREKPGAMLWVLVVLLTVSLAGNAWFIRDRMRNGLGNVPAAMTTQAQKSVPAPVKTKPQTAVAKPTFNWKEEIKSANDIKSIWEDKGKHYDHHNYEFLEKLRKIIEGYEK